MRNSFSLSVYFLLVLKSDVQFDYLWSFKRINSFRKMKLTFLCLVMVFTPELWAQKIDDEQFPYLPHYPPPAPGVFASDSSLYLPLEPHTAIPYFAIKNNNKLPFQYLPPTGTKAPSSFPTQFPIMMSSSLRPMFDEDDDDLARRRENRPSSTPQPPPHHKFNSTQRTTNVKEPEKREMRPIPRTVNFEHPIDRIDVKPSHFPMNGAGSTQTPINHTPASRRTIISVDSMGHRSDHGPDLIKAGAFPSAQYIHPGLFISSSTTEPAIPIIRLSNEMDLDGSFSYEALGADQTHYVQHSRMENMGTDKQEQVVEGSYSYVGDNGQTYTVHYIADSNGFRASGDHLPVPPPMPEIIQRAVQYNLAEEAKRPPHLKSWQDDEKNYESDVENIQRFPASPPRSLFTGRTPEAFSYSFSPGNTQNNLAAAASTQAQVKTTPDFTKDQTQAKTNNGPISPQITFLASQGAHVPSMNTAQQSISRVFTTEKSNMPQLMNYEAALKDAEQENNKALWRWQYGINANNQDQNSNKNTISRSSGDEVMINFNEMSPEQYTSMIHSQLEPTNNNNFQQIQYNYHPKENERLNKTETAQIQTGYEKQALNSDNQNQIINHNYNAPNTYDYYNYQNQNLYQNYNKDLNENTNNQYMNEVSPAPATEPSSSQPTEHTEQINSKDHVTYPQSKIITQHDFVPPSQTVTKSYDYEDTYYESRKIYDVVKDEKFHSVNSSPFPVYSSTSGLTDIEKEIRISTTEQPQILSSEANIRFMDFIKQEDDSKFRPVTNKNIIEEHSAHEATTTTTTTTQDNVEDILENNIFLKNFVRTRIKENDSKKKNSIIEEPKMQFYPKTNVEHLDKVPKLIQYQSQLLNDIRGYRKKTADFSDILNFVAQKNHFESSKVKPKSKPFNFSNTSQNNKMIYIPTFHEDAAEDHDSAKTNKNDFRTLNHQQQDELHGIIKKYKVLQRNNNNNIRSEEDRMNQLRRDLSPPPAKMAHSSNLPPLGRAGPSMKSYLPPVFV